MARVVAGTGRRWAAAGAAAAASLSAAHVQSETQRCRARLAADAAARWGGVGGAAALAAPLAADVARSLRRTERRLAVIEERLLGHRAGGPAQRSPPRAQRQRQRTGTVGTLNIMDGCRLQGLMAELQAGGAARAVDVLCVQENVLTPEIEPGSHHAARIAAAMGQPAEGERAGQRCFACHRCEEAPRLATIYDTVRTLPSPGRLPPPSLLARDQAAEACLLRGRSGCRWSALRSSSCPCSRRSLGTRGSSSSPHPSASTLSSPPSPLWMTTRPSRVRMRVVVWEGGGRWWW